MGQKLIGGLQLLPGRRGRVRLCEQADDMPLPHGPADQVVPLRQPVRREQEQRRSALPGQRVQHRLSRLPCITAEGQVDPHRPSWLPGAGVGRTAEGGVDSPPGSPPVWAVTVR